MKNFIIAAFLIGLYSCSNPPLEKERPVETKENYLQRVFLNEVNKQLEYTEKALFYANKWLETNSNKDRETMLKYGDSANMAYYCSSRAYKDMYNK